MAEPGGELGALPDPVRGPEAFSAVSWQGLSDFFEPFLPHFARESIRCGGEVRLARRDDTGLRALYLYHPVEREASVFSRDATLALAFARLRPDVATYSDFPLAPFAVPLRLYSGPARDADGAHRYRHRVRLAAPEDRRHVVSLLRHVHGTVDERWVESATSGEEDCLVVDGERELAGVGWATRVGAHGRLHSVAVRPRYRRVGIGTDLFFARREWLARNGALTVLTEIADDNVPSWSIAERGGLTLVGRIFRSPPLGPSRP